MAIFDVYLDKIGLTIRNMKLILNKKGGQYLGYPSFKDPLNADAWTPFFQWDEARKKEFESGVLNEMKEFYQG